MANKNKKTIQRIPGSALERSMRVLGFGIRTSISAIAKTRTALQQAEALAKMMSEMKGSIMKAGQLPGMVGEHFFPKEVNAVLRTLNAQSDPVAWAVIERALIRRLGRERLAELVIDEEPWAAASLGQVHRATIQATNQKICLKIQYPGVARAIEGDLRNLRVLLKFMGALPINIDDGPIFAEVRAMLRREVDYLQEKTSTREYASLIAGDARFLVPDVIDEYSGPRILATTWIDSIEIEDPAVRSMAQSRRKALAQSFLELFLSEFFTWNLVQTDPHFGNYRIRLGTNGESDRLVLLDFGAVRKFPISFVRNYARMVRGALDDDNDAIVAAGKDVGVLPQNASPSMTRTFVDLCLLIIEPFKGGVYDWGASDLPQRATRMGLKLIVEERLPSPPRELLFLDRKLGGVFIFLSHLGTCIDGRPLLERAISSCLQEKEVSP